MKRLKTILLFLVICISCFGQNRTRTNTNTNKRVIWEYKVIIKIDDKFYYSNHDNLIDADHYDQLEFLIHSNIFNKMGNEGWELVNVYTEVSTVNPTLSIKSFIDRNYKTQVINFVFKRPKSGK